jgi:hypothetical protein
MNNLTIAKFSVCPFSEVRTSVLAAVLVGTRVDQRTIVHRQSRFSGRGQHDFRILASAGGGLERPSAHEDLVRHCGQVFGSATLFKSVLAPLV